MTNTCYITTPIFYVNGDPHIGHWYTNIMTDVINRANLLMNYDVKMQTGTDEHGSKVQKSSEVSGENVMHFCNRISEKFAKMAVYSNCSCAYGSFSLQKFEQLSSTIDEFRVNRDVLFANGANFIRTTEGRNLNTGAITPESLEKGRHVKYVEKFWNKLFENGWIYKGKYAGWYAVRDEAFYSEDEVNDGKAPSGAPVEWKEEECYFFRLSLLQKALLSIYRNNENFIFPREKYTEVVAFVAGSKFIDAQNGNFKPGALSDLCISRPNLSWGIPVPGAENQAIYVWLDALTNYISAFEHRAEYEKYWLNRSDNSKVIHVVGKDILRFHGVYWPAFLLAENFSADEIEGENSKNLQEIYSIFTGRLKCLPSCIISHGWWTNNGEKMSKSLNNTIDPYLEIEFLQSCGVNSEIATDYFRYFLVRSMPFGNDGNYSREALINLVNADLANNIGNLAQRTVSMVQKYTNGSYSLVEIDYLQAKISEFTRAIQGYNTFLALELLLEIARSANLIIEQNKPWELAKQGRDAEISTILNNVLSHILAVSVCLQAFCPVIAGKILQIFGATKALAFDDIFTEMPANQERKIVSISSICPRITVN